MQASSQFSERESDCVRSVSERVVETVAAEKNLDPTALTPPLYQVVDSDALDTLFAADGRPTDCHVSFTYQGLLVHVDGDGRVSVEGVR